MKQIPHTAEKQRQLFAFLIFLIGISISACATLPRQTSKTQSSVELTKAATASKININTASAQELEKLPGVGHIIAERIVAYRTQYGSFRRSEHLMMVRGISDTKFREIQAMIVAE